MPSKGTRAHRFRLDDPLWEACLAKSKRTGVDVSSVVRERLEKWITEPDEETSEKD